MRVHLIALGGSIMHQLAIELQQNGHIVSGSDDEIFEPARSNLLQAGLLPEYSGWAPERITPDLDLIILGMHAHADNPELQRALESGIPVLSFPAFVARFSQDKQRIVIAGSHGKTTTTSMIMHAFQEAEMDYDYLVGAKLEGFSRMVKLTMEAPIMVLEGDEYLSSALDPNPKFLHYDPDILALTGIAWDHMNVFPTFANYLAQFSIFIDSIEAGGTLIYSSEDDEVAQLVQGHPRATSGELQCLPYSTPPYHIEGGQTSVLVNDKPVPLRVFGQHNLQNMEGARLVCKALGIDTDAFYEAIQDFTGASRRLEKLHETSDFTVYRDFAHAPSKLKATTRAVKEQHPDRKLIAFMELHTYSSLNKDFLGQYQGAMNDADLACVYFSPEVVAHKRLPAISVADVKTAFGRPDLTVFTNNGDLQTYLSSLDKHNAVLLLMSSGNWGGGIQW